MQQVNLYLPELRPKREWLTANTVALSCIGFVVLLVVASVLMHAELKNYNRQVTLIEDQVEDVKARVEKIKNIPRPISAVELDRRIATLRSAAKRRERIGDIIEVQNLGNDAGFSEPLLAFSRQVLPSIALQHIRISRGGAFVELKGETTAPQDIPTYLQRLQTEDSLSDSQFGLLSTAQKSSQANVHQFALGFESLHQLNQRQEK